MRKTRHRFDVVPEYPIARTGLRITVIVSVFPALSETFVLDQIVDFIKMGHDVRIIADAPRREHAVHEEVEQFNLLSRTSYLQRDRRTVGSRIRIVAKALRVSRWHTVGEMRRFRQARNKGGEVGEISNFAAMIVTLAELPQPDVILCHFGPNGSIAVRARDALHWPVPVVTIFHGYDLTRLVKQRSPALYDNLRRRGDLFLPACLEFADRLLMLGFPADKVAVQRMCVDLPIFDKINLVLTTRKTQQELFTFAIVGRLVEKKGHAQAIQAFEQAFAHTSPGTVRLQIIGDGPLRDELETTVREMAMAGHIEFLGSLRRRDVITILHGADAILQPSITASDGDMEASPVVISEAMALRKPVIGTSHSGIPELILDHVTGKIVGEGDMTAMAAAMVWMFENRSAALAMGEAGHKRIQDEFVAERWNRILERRLLDLVFNHRTSSLHTWHSTAVSPAL